MKSNEFIKGFAAALANINEMYDQPTMCAGAILHNGLIKEDFIKAKVDKFDMDRLKNVWKETVFKKCLKKMGGKCQ